MRIAARANVALRHAVGSPAPGVPAIEDMAPLVDSEVVDWALAPPCIKGFAPTMRWYTAVPESGPEKCRAMSQGAAIPSITSNSKRPGADRTTLPCGPAIDMDGIVVAYVAVVFARSPAWAPESVTVAWVLPGIGGSGERCKVACALPTLTVRGAASIARDKSAISTTSKAPQRANADAFGLLGHLVDESKEKIIDSARPHSW